MSYYDTLAEDITRAKEILERGRADRDMQQIEGMDPALREIMLRHSGGTIFGVDTYAAYKLLESFVAAIEQYAGMLRFRSVNPFDHNVECLMCDEMGEHAESCPWKLVETIKGYDPHG